MQRSTSSVSIGVTEIDPNITVASFEALLGAKQADVAIPLICWNAPAEW